MNDVKREIAKDRYEVDAAAVATAIVTMLTLIRRGREALALSEAGRSPKPEPQRRPPL